MPSWKDLKRFCERDYWELYKETDHWYFRKAIPNGTLKPTKVSGEQEKYAASFGKRY